MATISLQRLPTLPRDRALPGASDLLASSGAERVSRFLEQRGLEPRSVEPAQAHYRPGRWLIVCYRASTVDRSAGRPLCLTVTAEHRADAPERLWAFPDDPDLPGLAPAADDETVARRLRVPPGDVTVEPLRYRPRRRAVLRYRLSNGTTLFGKVVTPARARRLQRLTEALRDPPARPPSDLRVWERIVPDSGTIRSQLRFALPVGRIGRGAVLLPCAPGRTLRELLLAGAPLPAPGRVAALPAEIHRVWHPVLATSPELASPELADPRARRRFDPVVALVAARMVARLVPAEAAAAGRLAEAVIACAEASEPADDWVVHGDLYENQVLVDADRLTLIDLDDVGPGDPLLDAANFSAHLLLLATSGAPAAAVIRRYRAELQVASARAFDVAPADLAWREAYCLLRLVSGPFRVLHPEWPARMAARLTLATEALSARCPSY